MFWKWTVFLIICAILVFWSYIYVKYALITPEYMTEISIHQSSVEDTQPHHLFEKAPLILNESLIDPKELLQTLFHKLYTTSSCSDKIKRDVFHVNAHRHLVLYHTDDPDESGEKKQSIYIMHPKNSAYIKSKSEKVRSRAQFIEIRLRPFQVIILPYGWWYKIPSETTNMQTIKIHDTLSRLFGRYFV